MSDLKTGACEPCRIGAPELTDGEVSALQPQVPEWKVVKREGIRRIERAYAFPDFVSAMAFAVKVGELAEAQGHHPDLHVSWGRVIVVTWTHKIQGLHRNDFILAAKADTLYHPAN